MKYSQPAVVVVLVVAEHQFPYLAIPACIIVGREIIISGLREWMAEIGKKASVTVSFVAKVKTSVQMLALTILLAVDPNHIGWMSYLGYFMLYIAAIMTLWSMFMYLKTAWPEFELGK